MGEIRYGPSGLPEAPTFEESFAALTAEGYRACEIGFAGGFWLDYDTAPLFGAAAEAADVALSVHAPLAAFMGHADRGKKFKMALGMLDHTAGLAKACGARLIVFHPGFLLGREREQTIADVVDQLGDLRARLEAKDRLVPFGVEVMGRVRDFGTIDDVLAISAAVDFVRPVLDFAHMHATSDGAFLETDRFADALAGADAVLEAGRAVPHPLQRHPVREPERDEAPAVRRGDAAGRAAAGCARAVRARRGGHQRVAGRRVDTRDRRRPPRGSLGRLVADGLDVVAVGIEDVAAVVVVVVPADAGRAVVGAAGLERGRMEGVDEIAALRG